MRKGSKNRSKHSPSLSFMLDEGHGAGRTSIISNNWMIKYAKSHLGTALNIEEESTCALLTDV